MLLRNVISSFWNVVKLNIELQIQNINVYTSQAHFNLTSALLNLDSSSVLESAQSAGANGSWEMELWE